MVLELAAQYLDTGVGIAQANLGKDSLLAFALPLSKIGTRAKTEECADDNRDRHEYQHPLKVMAELGSELIYAHL